MSNFKYIYVLISATIGMLACSSAFAASILFGQVSSGVYTNDGDQLAQMLIDDGHDVDNVNLNTAVVQDLGSYDQVWVYDLFTGSDTSANQVQNYDNIANWFLGLSEQNLIADGRIISSAPSWTNANSMPPEDAWIQNYATQLDLRDGGLVLGTDHATPGQPSGVFVDGINEINSLIGINPFSSFFGSYPTSQALVDSESPLFISGLGLCRTLPAEPCINDNSTTSFAPAGLQPNGTTLTPVAYHGTVSDAFDNAAVSSTMGSITFGTCGGPGQPPCVSAVPIPAAVWLFGTALIGFVGMSRRRKVA